MMSVHILDEWEIAQMVNDEIDKVHSIQRRIGMLFYPYKDNKELLKRIDYEFGNLAYIENCIKIYKSSLILDI